MMPLSVAFPVLLNVNVCGGLVVPVVTVPNASELGETLAIAARPVPVNATGELVTVTFPVTVAVPFAVPAAVGENTTLMVQVEAAARVAPQVPAAAGDAGQCGVSGVAQRQRLRCARGSGRNISEGQRSGCNTGNRLRRNACTGQCNRSAGRGWGEHYVDGAG